MRVFLGFVRRRLPEKAKTDARQKAPTYIHVCGWKMELFAFPEPAQM